MGCVAGEHCVPDVRLAQGTRFDRLSHVEPLDVGVLLFELGEVAAKLASVGSSSRHSFGPNAGEGDMIERPIA
jgi:hypothetical protein